MKDSVVMRRAFTVLVSLIVVWIAVLIVFVSGDAGTCPTLNTHATPDDPKCTSFEVLTALAAILLPLFIVVYGFFLAVWAVGRVVSRHLGSPRTPA